MTNPISVLLLIGSAVVGPIEAQLNPLHPEITCTLTNPMKCSDPISESLPELCERAMREVGAEHVPERHDKYVAIIEHWALGQELVRCIRVPTGYKR